MGFNALLARVLGNRFVSCMSVMVMLNNARMAADDSCVMVNDRDGPWDAKRRV